jgi:hypothetical protein
LIRSGASGGSDIVKTFVCSKATHCDGGKQEEPDLKQKSYNVFALSIMKTGK